MLTRKAMLSMIGAAVTVVVSILSAARLGTMLSDPCQNWGESGQRHIAPSGWRGGVTDATIPSRTDALCRGRVSATTETKSEAAIRLIVVSGGLFLGGILGAYGAFTGTRFLLFAGAAILFIESFIVFSIAPLTLIVAVLFLLSTRRADNNQAVASDG